MSCVSLDLGQILSIIGAGMIAIGLVVFWIDNRRAANIVKMERAKRGLYADPDSFIAIDEEFNRRRSPRGRKP